MGPTAFAHKRVTDSARLSGNGQEKCTSYFIEPVQWMEPALLGVWKDRWSFILWSFGWVVLVFFLQRQNCVSSLKGKTPTQGAPSLFGMNFSSYGQILKCEIIFHKETSWCSAWADNSSQDVGQGLSAVSFYYEKDLWDLRSLLWFQANWVFWALVKLSWNPTRSQQQHFHTLPSASTAVCYTPGWKSPSSLAFWPVFN